MVKWSYVIFFCLFLFGVFLFWGFIGGADVESHGKVCDFGMGENLCWKWHADMERNGYPANSINEAISDYLN